MKNYQNEKYGFEISIPDEWSIYEGNGTSHSLGKDQTLIFKCRKNEAFNIQITPLAVKPSPYQVGLEFQQSAEKKGFTSLELGRIVIEGQEYVWARYYMGGGLWVKKYRIILNGFDYAITATCLEQKELLGMEKVWDKVVESFQLLDSTNKNDKTALKPVGEFKEVESQALSKSNPDGLKTYKNDELGFEINVPGDWLIPEKKPHHTPFGDEIAFGCKTNEAFYIQVNKSMSELPPELTEEKFNQFVLEKGYANLEFGRITYGNKEHVWAKYYMGGNIWAKKYLFFIEEIQYEITASCTESKNDLTIIAQKEKVWDSVVSSFRYTKLTSSAYKSKPKISEPLNRIAGPSITNHETAVIPNRISQSMMGMKTYRNEKHGFEIDIPETWSPVSSLAYKLTGALYAQNPPGVKKDCFQYGNYDEAFNFEIGSLFPEPLLDDTEVEFRLYAQIRGFTDLRFGRLMVAGKEHVCASYFVKDNMGIRWNKKYMIVFGGVEYTLTGTCNDQNYFTKREKGWDAIIQSFRLLKPVDDSANFTYKAEKDRNQRREVIQQRINIRDVGGELYAEAYEAVVLGKLKEARTLLKKCLQDNPNHVLAHKELAVVLKKMGDVKGALAHQKEVKRLNPSDIINRYNLAGLLARLGEMESANQEVEELQAMNPGEINKTIQYQTGLYHTFQATSFFENKYGNREENLKSAIRHFQQALEVLTRQDYPEDWVMTQNCLGEAYRHLSLIRDLNDNLSQAISHYEQALDIATRTTYPELWAAAHNNLGIAYANGTRGDVAENVEKAISHCQLALEVYTRDTLPDDWAMTQNNLGGAYRKRVGGDRAENIEQAISHFQQALEIQNHQTDREQWAGTHNNLSIAYWERLHGDRADNLEKIIFHAQQALEVYTLESHPQDWASMQHKLGATYQIRIHGNGEENIEKAIYHIEMAFKVISRQTDPENWAKGQTILGFAYQVRKRGGQDENIEKAISCFLHVLQVFTIQAFPTNWAVTQNYLAYAYQDRIRGDRTENMERAIGFFQQSLDVFTRQTYPEQWAVTHNCLAIAFINRKKGNRFENYDQAIHHCQQELEVYTRQSYPERWAMAQFFLGTIMMDRKSGKKEEYTEQAIQYYQRALEVFTRDKYPEEWAMTQNGLALAYKERDPNNQEAQSSLVGIPPMLTYPDFYNEESRQQPGKKCHLKLIYSDVPDDKYATSMLLMYQWEAELSEEEADRLKRRTVAYLCCAIYDIAKSTGVPCMTSPIPNGMRPAWMFQGERSPVSLTLSDVDVSNQTLQLSIGPITVMVSKLPINKDYLKRLLEGFRDKCNDIYI
jgi:tetratricopeptide (TPR) repeat protein